MAKYNWTFATVGGATRVKITSGEDIRHLGELDQKMWTVLSCPTTGLEIPDDTLKLMDFDGDGKIRVNEVVKTAAWLCSVCNADRLFDLTDSIKIADLNADNEEAAQMIEVAKRLAGDKDEIALADVLAAVAAVEGTIPAAEVKGNPEAPVDGGILAAYRANKEGFDKYFEDLRLEKLGLAKTDAETAPTIKADYWKELNEKVGAYDAEVAAVAAANAAAADARAAAVAAATAEYQPLIKFLRLKRHFCVLLRNYITLEDFYGKGSKAIFQCGTLIIDQRACDLCVRVQDAGAMGATAALSGMYLLFCDCVNKASGKTMSIIAAVTVGDIDDLFVGKNAIFYDRAGLDYDAKVTKIIDNPISIKQAFWSPYKKFGNWVKDLINKSAAEKESKGFEDMKSKATETTVNLKTEDGQAKKEAFDIAKFAGIFAAIGMALGFIGSFFVSLGQGISALTWWQLILVIIGILLCISGPSMFLAYLKLRARNLAPVLNANGWAVNARSLVSVPFGATLSEAAKFPIMPDQKKMPAWQKWCIAIACFLVVLVGLWLGNLFAWTGIEKLNSPLPCFNKEVVEEVAEEPEEAVAEEEIPAEEVAEASEE